MKFHYFLFVLLCCLMLSISTQSQTNDFIKAADGSVLDQIEQSGGIFYDESVETDAYTIFKKYGFNYIRLKLWHSPAEPYNSLPNVLKMAKRAKDLDLGLILDFHYSDTWADPAHQIKPSAWKNLSFELLSDSIYAYTKYVITQFKLQGTLPELVQIGNEISCGMLWNDGNVCNPDSPQQWNKLGILMKRAIQGMEEAAGDGESIKTIVHFDNGGNNGACKWFYGNILDEGIDFDIIGLSFYPWWHGTLSDLSLNLNDLATRYQKDIIVVEAAYPWTLAWNDNTNNIVGSPDKLLPGYPATVDGQYKYLKDLMNVISSTTGKKGIGIAYWSPEWISAPSWGSPWENVSLFDFDNNVLESIKAFEDHTGLFSTEAKLRYIENFPNPFVSQTNITFMLSEKSSVDLAIADINGKTMYRENNLQFRAGLCSIPVKGNVLKAGIYLVTLNIDGALYHHQIIKSE